MDSMSEKGRVGFGYIISFSGGGGFLLKRIMELNESVIEGLINNTCIPAHYTAFCCTYRERS
jgi:hypothetical protein